MKENKVVINVLLIIIMILVVGACVIAYMCFTNDVEIISLYKLNAKSKASKYNFAYTNIINPIKHIVSIKNGINKILNFLCLFLHFLK